MSIEKGTEENKAEAQEINVNQALTEQIAAMQKQLEELQKSKTQPSAVSVSQENQDVLLEKLVAKLARKSDDEIYGKSGNNYVAEEDIDEDDYVKDGATFFCHQAGYIIVDDKKNGLPIQTPFRRPIVFNYQFTHKKGQGKHQETYNLSSYTSHSAKEIEWLRKSSFYGIYIFDSTKEAMSVDHAKATKLSKYMSRSNGMDRTQVLKACKSVNLPVLGDLDRMRAQLADFWATKELKEEIASNEIRIKNALVSSELEEKILNDKIV